jgi:hypothetical protein
MPNKSETPANAAGVGQPKREASLAAPTSSAAFENVITAPNYGYAGIDMMALLAAVMERYKDIPENERRAGLQWFASKYGVGG